MKFIKIYDNSRQEIVVFPLEEDNIIRAGYFTRTFPGATGLIYREQSKDLVWYVKI